MTLDELIETLQKIKKGVGIGDTKIIGKDFSYINSLKLETLDYNDITECVIRIF